jgi:glycolate oxidase iron-sulfur subunit
MDAPALDLLSGASDAADCVHCGFCLDACPTYLLWAQETDSPRGRIVLIDDAIAAGGQVTDALAEHLDTCLGCLACVPACPSGVRYDRLLERGRAAVERQHRRSLSERALRRVLYETLPHPGRLNRLAPLLAAGLRLGAARLPEPLSVLARVAPRPPSRAQRHAPLPAFTPARGERRGRVALLLGCVQRVFFPDVHRATIAVLAAEGYDVLAPQSPDCCGALELHAGEADAALRRARTTVAAFGGLADLDHIVVNAAGCGSALKAYGELLGDERAQAFSARVRDVSELLDEPPRAPRGRVALRVAYHDACHLLHGQGLAAPPRAMLAAIPGLELLEVGAEAGICCGSAGIYNVVQPQAAAELGRRKARHLIDTGADAVAAANPGCAAQLERHLRELGRPLPVHHPIELVAMSLSAGQAQTR